MSRESIEGARRGLARIRGFQEMWKQNEPERLANRTALDNGNGAFDQHIQIIDGSGNRIPLTVLNFFVRLRNRTEAHCFDESPEITYPREAAGDESVADGIGRLISRATEDARLPFECRDGVANLMTEGGFGIVYGMPNLPTAQQVDERAKGTAGIVEGAAQGVVNPVPGQDHDTAATVLTEQALDPVNVLVNSPQVTASMLGGAAAHLEAKEDEDASGLYWNRKEDLFYAERVELGSHLTFDTSRGDHRLGRWLAHAVEMPYDEAIKHPLFKPSVRSRLVAQVPTPPDGDRVPPTITWAGQSDEERLEENGVVKVWFYYDRAEKKRHIIPEQLKDGDVEYLEVDDLNPYLDDNGDALPVDFWPVKVFIYRRSAKPGPFRALPIPYMRDGWDQQIESIKFDTMLIESTKAALTDKYLADENVDDDTMQAITDGRVHAVIKKPAGSVDAKNVIEAIQFKPPLQEAFMERRHQQDRFCIAVNFPISQFTSQPVADTLGQDELALSSGNDQIADVVRMMQCFYAEVCQDALRILAAKMPAEVAAEFMGVGFEEQWEGWRQTSMRGDLLRVKFAPTTREQNPVRAKQLMDAYTVSAAARHPLLPMFPQFQPSAVAGILSEATKCLGVGALPKFEPTPDDIAVMMSMQPQQTQTGNGGGENPQNANGGGQRSPQQVRERPNRQAGGRQDRGREPPGTGQINAGARRTV